MKKIITILFIFAIFSSLISCTKDESENNAQPAHFVGKAIEIYEYYCLLEVTDEGNFGHLAKGTTVKVMTDSVDCPEYALGDHLKVVFDGAISKSNPPQVLHVISIEKTDSAGNKIVNTITDFSKFSGMTRTTDKINVEFDNYSGYPFYFTIEEQNDIDEIMDIIFSSEFTKMQREANAGDHTSITIIQGEKEYRVHAFMNKEGEHYYSFSTTELQLKLNELAREAGAFEESE